MRSVLKQLTKFIFFIIVLLLIIGHLFSSVGDNLGGVIGLTFLLISLTLVMLHLYKKKVIKIKFIIILIVLTVLLSIAYRIYFYLNMNAELIFNTELMTANIVNNFESNWSIFNGELFYFVLSFNLQNITDNLLFYYFINLIITIITSYVIYVLLKRKVNRLFALTGSVIYFVLPSTILSMFLIAPINIYILLLSILFYFYIIKFKNSNSNIVIKLVVILLSSIALNALLPLMSAFIIAVLLYELLLYKNMRRLLLVFSMVVLFYISNFSIMNLRSTNNNYLNDSTEVICKNSNFGNKLNFTGDYGNVSTNYILKYECSVLKVWSSNNPTSMHLSQFGEVHYSKFATDFNVATYTLLMLGTLTTIYKGISTKSDDNMFIYLFLILYIVYSLFVHIDYLYTLILIPFILFLSLQTYNNNFFNSSRISDEKRVRNILNDTKVLLIIPAYNEEENIEHTIKSISESNVNVDYIIINDGSTDRTLDICKKNKFKHVNLIQNLGIGGAVQTGYKYAKKNGYEIAIQFDADGQHDINYVNNLIKPILNGQADFVIGSRFIGDECKFKSSFMRRVGITLISNLITLLTNEEITDPTSGFRACNKEIIDLFANSYPTEYPEPESIISLFNAGFLIKEIPVKMYERLGGVSSINSLKSMKYMIVVTLSMVLERIRRSV